MRRRIHYFLAMQISECARLDEPEARQGLRIEKQKIL